MYALLAISRYVKDVCGVDNWYDCVVRTAEDLQGECAQVLQMRPFPMIIQLFGGFALLREKSIFQHPDLFVILAAWFHTVERLHDNEFLDQSLESVWDSSGTL
jgi:hypothetical protein